MEGLKETVARVADAAEAIARGEDEALMRAIDLAMSQEGIAFDVRHRFRRMVQDEIIRRARETSTGLPTDRQIEEMPPVLREDFLKGVRGVLGALDGKEVR